MCYICTNDPMTNVAAQVKGSLLYPQVNAMKLVSEIHWCMTTSLLAHPVISCYWVVVFLTG